MSDGGGGKGWPELFHLLLRWLSSSFNCSSSTTVVASGQSINNPYIVDVTRMSVHTGNDTTKWKRFVGCCGNDIRCRLLMAFKRDSFTLSQQKDLLWIKYSGSVMGI